jgi:hypothetical protein
MLPFSANAASTLDPTCYRSAFNNQNQDTAGAANAQIEAIATGSNTFSQN